MDFQYIKIRKKDQEAQHDTGKLNFYIINKRYKYMKEFLNAEMFKNMVIIIAVDLEKPKEIKKAFK